MGVSIFPRPAPFHPERPEEGRFPRNILPQKSHRGTKCRRIQYTNTPCKTQIFSTEFRKDSVIIYIFSGVPAGPQRTGAAAGSAAFYRRGFGNEREKQKKTR